MLNTMLSIEDQEKLKSLLTEALTVLCRNCLHNQGGFSIEALIGVRLKSDNIFLFNINEEVTGEGEDHCSASSM